MNIKRNFIFYLLLTSSNLLFPLITFPYLSRILGAEGLGICNFLLSYGNNYIIIAALGTPIYGSREIAKVGNDKDKRSKLFFELLSIHFLFTLILLTVYIASIIFSQDFENYKQLGLLGISFILFNVFSIEWLFTGVNDFKYITIRGLIIRTLSIIAIYIFVKSKDDFTIYFIILICTMIFSALVNVFHAKKFISRNITISIKDISKHIKPIFILGIYMVLTNIYSVLPTTLLGFLSTKLAVGYYYGANKVIRMTISIFTALITVLIPRLNVEIEKKEKEEYHFLVNKALIVVVTFGVPISFLVFLLANPIVMLLAGKSFINSILLIKIMAPIVLIVAFAQVFVLLILSVNRKDKQMVTLSIIGMTISLFVNFFFIPLFAEKATAISQLLAEVSVTLVSFVFAKRVLNFHFPTKLFLLNIVLVIPFSIFTFFSFKLTSNNFLIILISCICCGSYFLFYQIFIIKDKFLKNLMEIYLKRIRTIPLPNQCEIAE